VHLAELDGLRKRFSRFGEIDYLKAPDLFTKAFLIADTALVSLIYNSLRIINATYHHEFMEEILDNEDQSVNLLTGNYTRLVENAVHVNEFVRVYLGVVFLKYIKRKKYIKISEENYEVIFGYLRDINLLFSEYGLGNLFQFLRRMFKKETYRLWFPLQKNVAEAMGAIRLPIRDYNLIATEQIQLMQEQLLPEFDDAFAKTTGQAETALELRMKIREDIERQKKNEFRRMNTSELVSQVCDKNQVPIPNGLVNEYLSAMVDDAKKQNPELEEADLRNSYQGVAVNTLRWHLLYNHLAEKEKIEVLPADTEKVIKSFADNYRIPVEQARDMLQKTGKIKSIQDTLIEEKVIDFLMGKAEVVEKKEEPQA